MGPFQQLCCAVCSIECTFIVIDPSRADSSDAAYNGDRTAGEASYPTCMTRAPYLVYLHSYTDMFSLALGSLVFLSYARDGGRCELVLE